jgi:mannitol/fructose-specific phosphotransferase system IIA component (Ntr-type)
VHLVFLVLTPEEDYSPQLQIMAGLSKNLTQAAVREQLLSARDEEGLWALLHDAITRPA